MRRLHVKRDYDPVSDEDGERVLVDRLWPRGISKEKARIELWLKDVSPSGAQWKAFLSAYATELTRQPALSAIQELRRRLGTGPVTLDVRPHRLLLAPGAG